MSEDLRNYFLDVFERPQRTFDKCECARSEQPNLAQVLHLLNGQWLHDKVSDPNGKLAGLMKAGKSDEEILLFFYQSAFGRPPTLAERQSIITQIQRAPSRKEGLEDFLWSLCNSREFLFNH